MNNNILGKMKTIILFVSVSLLGFGAYAQSQMPTAWMTGNNTSDVNAYKIAFIHWASSQQNLDQVASPEIVNFYNAGDFEMIFKIQCLKGNAKKINEINPVNDYLISKDAGNPIPSSVSEASSFGPLLINWVNKNPLAFYNLGSDFRKFYAKSLFTGDFSEEFTYLKQTGKINVPANNGKPTSYTLDSQKSSNTNNLTIVSGTDKSDLKDHMILPEVVVYSDRATTIKNYTALLKQWKTNYPTAYNAQEAKIQYLFSENKFVEIMDIQLQMNHFTTPK